MTTETRPSRAGSIFAYLVAFIGICLIGYGLVWLLRHYTKTPGVDAARGAERLKARTDLATAAADQVSTYGYVDATKNQVRLPVDRAMELVVSEWKDPVAGRAKLVERFKTMNPPPPPPAAPKPSEFE